VIDPSERWRRFHGRELKPAWAGLPTFADLPYSEEPTQLAAHDVAIVGAPMDDLVSDAPGTRFGPRVIRTATPTAAYDLRTGIDWSKTLRVVDYGDAPVVPHDAVVSHRAIEAIVVEVARAGVVPVVLGGDHSITEPDVRGCAAVHGPVGLVHFDTHTDTAAELYGHELSHGTPMYHLVEHGQVDPARYVQIGLRGWWPQEPELEWQAQRGITSFFMQHIRELGIEEVVGRAIAIVGEGPAFLTVDVDVLDPAFAPGTGTPEPGGMTPLDLLWACRAVATELELVGADIVEVLPLTLGDVTALVANRVVREILTGLALRRRSAAGS